MVIHTLKILPFFGIMHERVNTVQLINLMKHENCHHMETTQLIYPANKLTGFYMMATLAFNELTLVANGVTLKTLIMINDKLIRLPPILWVLQSKSVMKLHLHLRYRIRNK